MILDAQKEFEEKIAVDNIIKLGEAAYALQEVKPEIFFRRSPDGEVTPYSQLLITIRTLLDIHHALQEHKAEILLANMEKRLQEGT